MGKVYKSPTAFRSALKQATVTMSKQTGMSIAELTKIFYFNRLAARVFTKEPDGWLIKGGQALLVRYRGAARLSQDIDLQSAYPDRTAEQARQLVVEAASLDLGDYLRYVPGKFENHSDEGRGGAQYFRVFLGTALVDTVKVDLVVGRTLSGVPEVRTLRSAVDIEWPVDWPEVRLYPVIDHIADKVCAMYERHGRNAEFGSSRYRDLADVLLISQQEAVPAHVSQAVHREAERRRRNGTYVILPAGFQAPGPDWPGGYPKQAALVLGLQGCRTYAEAAKATARFIDPVLDQTARGTWDPRSATWT
ncbi:nucleotidyl transferase AbiEii/AbiGii toxin family protein [Streptomyces sp. NPDC048208]|uniref:nucleotidyl transferase AbiEii/AbiGii toxin family protein n=1 Tax=unclassified Streptomyces TaxID=2593676 RepID=UPI001370CC6F|nr:nucleotidyl transferase AbiEii/AbiGii toxin family protein [Streptomyces sp. SID4982]MYS13914.1 nucleotidyl transferase AbiEii/AbiGii toxin family protein [Streptomyces sp. SID4982]